MSMKPIWNRWQCFLKSVWGGFPLDYYLDGHEWVETEKHENCTVTITKCEVCGKQEIAWTKRNY